MAEKNSDVARAKADLAVVRAKLEVAEAEAKLFLAENATMSVKDSKTEARKQWEQEQEKIALEAKFHEENPYWQLYH